MSDYKNRQNEYNSKKPIPGKPELPAFQAKAMPPKRRSVVEAVMNMEEAVPSNDHL
jgi:hypothetical protein